MASWQAQRLHEQGDEAGWLGKLEEAARLNPADPQYRAALLGARERVATRAANAALQLLAAGRLQDARVALDRANRIAPELAQVRTASVAVEQYERMQTLREQARRAIDEGRFSDGATALRELLRENAADREARRWLQEAERRASVVRVSDDANTARRVSLEFRATAAREILLALAGKVGIGLVFDPAAEADVQVTVLLKDATVNDAFRHVLASANLERKKVSANTFLIYSPTPDKLSQNRVFVTRTFYVANADVKQTAMLLKQMAKVGDVFVDEKEGLLIIREPPEVVRLAERLVAIHNRPRPEVLLEVEVLEVGENALTDIGLRWPDQVSAGLAPPQGASGSLSSDAATFPLPVLRNLNSSFVTVTLPNPILAATLRAQAGGANTLANPRIRVRQREKARILIGDKVPVVTTTSTANGFVSESVNYLDVGIKLEAQPEISADDEVAVALSLEVSNIAREIRTNSGSIAYQVGTRSASTVLQLQDGETQVLAGLISDEERGVANKVPVLGDLPVVGRLFSHRNSNRARTEVILLLTPRIVRSHLTSGPSSEAFESGSESRFALDPVPDVLPSVVPAATPKATAPARLNSGTEPTLLAESATSLSGGDARGSSDTVPLADAGQSPAADRHASAQKVALQWRAPRSLRPGQTVEVPLLIGGAASGAKGAVEISFNPSIVRVSFAPSGNQALGVVDNGIGKLTLSIDEPRGTQDSIRLGTLSVTAVTRRPGTAELRSGSTRLQRRGGGQVKLASSTAAIAIEP